MKRHLSEKATLCHVTNTQRIMVIDLILQMRVLTLVETTDIPSRVTSIFWREEFKVTESGRLPMPKHVIMMYFIFCLLPQMDNRSWGTIIKKKFIVLLSKSDSLLLRPEVPKSWAMVIDYRITYIAKEMTIRAGRRTRQ